MKFITIATLLLVSAFASAQCTNNREVNGNPCTNITTKGGFVFNGNPNSFALETQDGVTNTSTSSQGLFYLNSAGGMQTLLPIDPLFTLGYNVISPFHYPAIITVGALSDGSTLTIDTPCGRGGPYPFTKLGLWSYFSGTETIDPPDANGNNTFTWNGTLSVPFTFDHCISTGGRGAGSAPVYLIGTGVGELSATPSYVGG